jgi:fatty acid desaturase
LGFTGQSLIVLANGGAPSGMTARQHRLAIAQTLAAVVVWALVGYLVGPMGFLFAFVIPHLIANAVVMVYILSNHSLSPLTQTNDPLLNSLSVTAPRLLEVVHLQFGFHVEHHLFPAMSPRHAHLVREGIRRRWPGRYQAMSLARALHLLWISPRVYENATTLFHPRSQERWQALRPCED